MLNMAKFSFEIEVIHAKCRSHFRKESEHMLTSLQIIGCLVKGEIKN